MAAAIIPSVSPGEGEDNSGRCLFCMQEPNYMIDPRQLPCGDFVCFPCFEEKSLGAKFTCPACSGHNTVNNALSLPKVELESSSLKKTNDSDTMYTCDICDGTPEATHGYCMTCDKMMCNTHKKLHDEFFKHDKHKVVKAVHFTQRPEYYSNPQCEIHTSNPVAAACHHCYQLKCFQCLPSKCDKDESHDFASLDKVRAALEAKFEALMEKCADKAAELCALEKKTWQAVDSLSEKCLEMVYEVDQTAEKQVTAIREKADALKQEITEYQSKRIEEVGDYLGDLSVKRDNLQMIQVSVRRFIRDNHVKEIISQREARCAELETAGQVDTETEFDCQEIVLKSTGMTADLTLTLQPMIADSLDYHSSIVDDDSCVIYTVELLNRNKLLIGTGNNKIQVFDTQSQKQVKEERFPSTIQSISFDEKSGNTIVLCLDRKAYLLTANTDVMSNPKILFTYEYSSCIPRLATHGDLVIMSNPYYRSSNLQLLVHSLTSGETGYYYLEEVNWIRSICFHPDGDLLVLNAEDGTVRKYTVYSEKKPRLVSTVSGLPKGGNCSAICVDKSGLIYVMSTNQTLHVIYNGNIIKEITNERLPRYGTSSSLNSCSISMINDILVTTRKGSSQIDVFTLK